MLNSRILVAIMMLLLFWQPGYTSETAPEPGGICTEPDAIYNYSTDIVKTPWKLSELYAVPVGTMDPTAWEFSSEFRAQFNAELQSGETAQEFAQACAVVWQNFFTGDADVMVTVGRTITTTHITLQCVSGNWVIVSTDQQEFDDVSDWLTASGSPFDVTDPGSAGVLEVDLETILTNLNAQPGAASDP